MNRSRHILFLAALLTITLVSVLLSPREAVCRLSGEADLGYADYRSGDGKQSFSGNSFTQRYSVLYDTFGSLAGGRLGRYDLSLGYEFLAYDTTERADSQKTSSDASRSHLNYSGNLILNPKELPLKLHIYSNDPNRSRFSSNADRFSLGGAGGYTPLVSNLTNDIENGIHVTSGATLVMGVKNGMTNGYNEVLRHFPMLMLDYRDEINRDRARLFPVDTRLSRLAFVSLNKKDNWFHYRYVTFEDKINSLYNYNEFQFQLGTVDHRLERRWIDFSNWLSVSADLQYTERMHARTDQDYDETSLNLFGTARRQSWQARTFMNFTRLNELNLNTITYKTSLPLYGSGTISPTAEWSANARYNENKTNLGESFSTVSSRYAVNAFRKSPFTLTQGLGVEKVTTSSGNDSLLLTGNIDTNSTVSFSKKYTVKANYFIRHFVTDTNGGASSRFTSQDIRATASYSPTNQLRLTAQESFSLTTGTSRVVGSTIQGAEINTPLYQSPREGAGGSGGSSYHSVTDLRAEWMPKPRLLIAVSANEDIYAQQTGEESAIFSASALLNYKDSNLDVSSRTSYYKGDGTLSQTDNWFSSVNSAGYIFSRTLDARFGLTYTKMLGGNSQRGAISVNQSLNYRYRLVSGISRSLFEINELFASEQEVDGLGRSVRRANTVQLGAKYYPLRQLMVAGGAKYFFADNNENAALNYFGSVALNYRLLEASVDYAYGKNKVDGRVEKRLSANLKKRF